MFSSGFSKTAAFGRTRSLLNKLKGLVTGKETFYHGTSSRSARRILKEGLVPGGGMGAFRGTAGITGGLHGKGMKTFLTRNPDIAEAYSRKPQASRIMMKHLAKKGKSGPRTRDILMGALKAQFGTIPGRVLKTEIPKESLKRYGVKKYMKGVDTASRTIPAKYIKRIK
jgi:hypothetical protein